MVLFYIVFLIPLITATRRSDVPSYRSNVMEGEKPILRMAPEPDDEEPNNSDYDEDIVIQKFVILEPTTESPADQTADDPVETPDANKKTGLRTRISNKKHDEEKGTDNDHWTGEEREPSRPTVTKVPAEDMKRLVNWLIDNFGYDLVAMGRKNNDGFREGDEPVPNDASNKNEESGAGDDEEVMIQKFQVMESEPTTESSGIEIENSDMDPTVDAPVDAPVARNKTGLRTQKNNKNKKKHKKEKEDPQWVEDLKNFIKDLTTRYGQHEVLEKTKPVIASLEKKHQMRIKDIDVDEYGEIHINYTKKRKNKKARRQKKKRDDS